MKALQRKFITKIIVFCR